ncbi:MAG TPA: hypothetical protein VGP04_21070, partial [Pseudonocardiaceae bacterium]|nr:hypothetical protein [Pseudonocardiaceae bacterium]
RPTVSRPTGSRSAGGGPAGSREELPVGEHGEDVLVPALRALAPQADLAAAARLLREEFPLLAGLLRRAAGPDQEVGPELDGGWG